MTANSSHTKPAPTKPEAILKLILRKNGAPLKSLENATGWQLHSVRAALTGLRKKGHAIECGEDDKGVTIYRLTE